jgi:hypothetical protein
MIVSLMFAGQSYAQIDSENILGIWLLDEGTGDITEDASGNGNDGTLGGGPTWIDGVFGKALDFSGSSSYVDCGNAEALNVDVFSVSFWCYIPSTQSWNHMISRGEHHGGGNPGAVNWGVMMYADQETILYETYNDTVKPSLSADTTTGEWHHVVATHDGATMQLYHDGQLAGSTSTAGIMLDENLPFIIGAQSRASGPSDYFDGSIDEVGYFNTILSPEDIEAIMNNGLAGIFGDQPLARRPDPEDGAILEQTWFNLLWTPGDFAVSHDVYLGDNFDDVNNGAESVFQGNHASTMLLVGFVGFPFPDGLVPGTTYYWRIDEVNDADPNSPWKGPVWSFWIPPKKAYEPKPADGVKFVNTDVELSWTAGFGTRLHYVYFGDNFDDVNSATVGIPSPLNNFTPPGPLAKDATYYWRIDGFDGIATHKGDVWSFSTLPVIPIVDPHLIGWWKFDGGSGNTAVDWSGHDNHGSLTGTALSWMPDDGMIGGALSFDGTASNTNYVEISTADISLTAGTIAMWSKLRPNPQSPATRYFFGHTTIPAWNDRMQLYMDNSDTMLDLGLGDSHAIHTDIMSLTTETWYHVALTWDGGNYAVYVNGEQKANGSYTDLATLNTVADIGNDGNPGDRSEAFNGLLDNVRIYDYALSQAEIALAMRGDPLLAWAPNPAPGSTPHIRDATPLSWSPGDNASQHDIYFGADKDAVSDADASDTTGIYRGRQGATFYTPPDVEWGGGPYYWRIDEYNTDGTISKGNVWSFTVIDFIEIDGIEDYNDYPPDEIFSTWIDGWEVPTNGSMAGHADPPFAETGNVHGGSQSMPVYYENNFKYSEITMTLVSVRDWTEEGVGLLSLWFYGDSANAAERMYVNLNGIATVYHNNPDAALIEEWTQWTIDLQEFAAQGVNLANVNTISIGFGDKNNLQAGGSGKMAIKVV